jgi:hypothetical protein
MIINDSARQCSAVAMEFAVEATKLLGLKLE